jgi:hypothetical protein
MLTVYKYLSNNNFKEKRGVLAVVENGLIRSNGLKLRKRGKCRLADIRKNFFPVRAIRH